MSWCKEVCLVVLMYLVAFSTPIPPHRFIFGGNEAIPGTFPSIASIRVGKAHLCGGVLLRVSSLNKSDVILTAAHCVEQQSTYNVHLGAHYRSQPVDGEVKVKSVDARVHPRFKKPATWANDIALLKLDRPISFSTTIQPAHLPQSNEVLPDNTPCVAAGWGVTDNSKSEDALQEVHLAAVDTKACNETYGYEFDAESMICAGKVEGQRTAGGDSGGPLFCKPNNGTGILYGLNSFGNVPDVFAHVSAQIKWIEREVQRMTAVQS